jgi:hypothetical protein
VASSRNSPRVVDVLFPIEAMAESAKEFRDRFPRMLRRHVETDATRQACSYSEYLLVDRSLACFKREQVRAVPLR